MSETTSESAARTRRSDQGGVVAWLIGPAFLILAGWFLFVSPKATIPVGEVHLVARDRFVPGPIRTPMTDPAHVKIGGFDHACNECHKLFESPPVEKRRLTQHSEIILRHGMNDRCFNCHDRQNREKLALHDGTTIGFDDVPHLCSQCHGTVYRDWQRGTHGKTLGSWDASSGKQRRLKCNECHDPHSPAYPKFVPLPGPNTLRMGNQSVEEVEHERHHRPLRRWSEPVLEQPQIEPGDPSGHEESKP